MKGRDAFEPTDAFFTEKALEPQPPWHLFRGLTAGRLNKNITNYSRGIGVQPGTKRLKLGVDLPGIFAFGKRNRRFDLQNKVR